MALITAAEAREYLPELTGTAEDTVIDGMIAAIGVAFARWCEYPADSSNAEPTLESATYLRYLTGSGGRKLTIDVRPLVSITSIYDDQNLTWAASSLVASGDYAILDKRMGVVLLTSTATHGAWSDGDDQAIKATFVAGYATVPAPIKLAAKMAVKAVWDLRSHLGKNSVSGAAQNIGLRDEEVLSAPVRELLTPYRLSGAWL